MRIAHLVVLAALAGCSQTADSVKPATVSGGRYAGMSCQQLAAEAARVDTSLADLSARQNQAAEKDKGAFVMGGLIGASMVGEDHASEIARLKGERSAIASARAGKGC